eukprot:GSA25T00010194001.1
MAATRSSSASSTSASSSTSSQHLWTSPQKSSLQSPTSSGVLFTPQYGFANVAQAVEVADQEFKKNGRKNAEKSFVIVTGINTPPTAFRKQATRAIERMKQNIMSRKPSSSSPGGRIQVVRMTNEKAPSADAEVGDVESSSTEGQSSSSSDDTHTSTCAGDDALLKSWVTAPSEMNFLSVPAGTFYSSGAPGDEDEQQAAGATTSRSLLSIKDREDRLHYHQDKHQEEDHQVEVELTVQPQQVDKKKVVNKRSPADVVSEFLASRLCNRVESDDEGRFLAVDRGYSQVLEASNCTSSEKTRDLGLYRSPASCALAVAA